MTSDHLDAESVPSGFEDLGQTVLGLGLVGLGLGLGLLSTEKQGYRVRELESIPLGFGGLT